MSAAPWRVAHVDPRRRGRAARFAGNAAIGGLVLLGFLMWVAAVAWVIA